MSIDFKKTIIITFVSTFVLIGGLNIGTREIDKAKKLNAIRTCKSQLIEYKESALMDFRVISNQYIEEKEENPTKKGFYYKILNSYAPIELRFNNKKIISDFPISKYIKLIDFNNQFYKIMKFDSQIFANTYIYNCISERNLSIFTSRKVKAKKS